MHTRTKKILDFWFKETPPKKRFQKHKDFDALIKKNFLKDYELDEILEHPFKYRLIVFKNLLLNTK